MIELKLELHPTNVCLCDLNTENNLVKNFNPITIEQNI